MAAATFSYAFGAVYGGPAILVPAIIVAVGYFWLSQRRKK
jgi:hypothetical protein